MKQLPSASSDNRMETLLIAGTLVPQLLGFLFGKSVDSYWLFMTSFICLLALIAYYIYTYSTSKKIFFLLLMAVALLADILLEKQYPLYSIRIGARSLLGVWMMFFAVKHIIKTKSFEMLTFIAALFLIFNGVLYFSFATQDNIQMIVLFGSAFTLATLIYYENLWDQYDAAEKKWIIVCVLTLLVDVLFFSKGLF